MTPRNGDSVTFSRGARAHASIDGRPGRAIALSGERDAVLGEQARERLGEKEIVFALAQRRQRIDPFELGIDATGMAHDHAAVGHGGKETGKQRGKIGIAAKYVRAGERRVGEAAEVTGAAGKAAAEPFDQEPLWIGKAREDGSTAGTLARPGAQASLFDGGKHGLAQLRQVMHVPMPVDEIGRAPKRRLERGELRPHFRCQRGAVSLRMNVSRMSCCRLGNVRSAFAAKPLLSGRNGVVKVKCRPIATRRLPALRMPNASASERVKLGAATMAEVALMRPRRTRSRIAALTAGEMP